MQNNLEGISFDEVVDSNGNSYAAFRNNLHPRYRKVLFDIIKGYFFLLLVSSATIILTQQFYFLWWLIVPLSGLFIGYIAAYLALFIHEAGHYNIHPDKKKNDWLAGIFLCLLFGLSLKSYRKIHWQHHVHLGTPQDTEVSYFNALTKLFFIETLTGVHLLRTIIRKKKNSILTKAQLQESRSMLLAGILFHSIIVVAAMLTNNWPFAISWVAGFGIFFPFFATIRQILEHRDEFAGHKTNFYEQSHGKLSRLFVHTVISSSFGSAGFTRHLIHHWDPQISYTRLRDIEKFLSRCERTSAIIRSSRTTYSKVFKKLITAP